MKNKIYDDNDLNYYKKLVKNYLDIIKYYEELTDKIQKKYDCLFIENLNLKDTNAFYNNSITKRLKDRLKVFIGYDIKIAEIKINKILIVDDDVRIILDEKGGFYFAIRHDGVCVYEDSNSYITDNVNEIKNLSTKAKFYYDNRNELINILREYMIYSEKF